MVASRSLSRSQLLRTWFSPTALALFSIMCHQNALLIPEGGVNFHHYSVSHFSTVDKNEKKKDMTKKVYQRRVISYKS